MVRQGRRIIPLILILVLSGSLVSTVEAHPGRTDKYGGHYDRKTGLYHYHGGGSSPSIGESPEAASQPDAVDPADNTSSGDEPLVLTDEVVTSSERVVAAATFGQSITVNLMVANKADSELDLQRLAKTAKASVGSVTADRINMAAVPWVLDSDEQGYIVLRFMNPTPYEFSGALVLQLESETGESITLSFDTSPTDLSQTDASETAAEKAPTVIAPPDSTDAAYSLTGPDFDADMVWEVAQSSEGEEAVATYLDFASRYPDDPRVEKAFWQAISWEILSLAPLEYNPDGKAFEMILTHYLDAFPETPIQLCDFLLALYWSAAGEYALAAPIFGLASATTQDVTYPQLGIEGAQAYLGQTALGFLKYTLHLTGHLKQDAIYNAARAHELANEWQSAFEGYERYLKEYPNVSDRFEVKKRQYEIWRDHLR